MERKESLTPQQWRLAGFCCIIISVVYFLVASTVDALIPLIFGICAILVGFLRRDQNREMNEKQKLSKE